MAALLESELRQLGYTDTTAGSETVSPGHLVPWGLGVRPRLALPPD
jgi:hypothetical protein